MNNILFKFKHLFIVLIIAGFTSSCCVTQTSVGKYAQSTGTEYTYSKAKQMWLFWGLVPFGKTHLETPVDGQCMVQTQLNPLDVLATYFSFGIFGMQTIKVKAKR